MLTSQSLELTYVLKGALKTLFNFYDGAFLRGTRAFFISNTFISNVRLNLAKYQGKAKQHPMAELLLFENYSLSSSRLSSKIIRILKKVPKASLSVLMTL